MLKEPAAAGVTNLCRRQGINDATFYTWRKRYVSDARGLKALEDENARLKLLLAEQVLDAATPREALRKDPDAQVTETLRELSCRRERRIEAPAP